jgi:uncharacterized RDD family membrane protein YckC
MDNIRIQTTQNVDIEYEAASIGDRILATLLDYLFFIAYVLLITIVLVVLNGFKAPNQILFFVLLLPILFYDLLCEVFFDGRSFGKMIMHIKVVKLDGSRSELT